MARGGDAEFACTQGCGQMFKMAGWMARHAMKCTGEAPATEGRIAKRMASTRTGVRVKHAAKPAPKKKVVRKPATKPRRGVERKGVLGRTPPGAVTPMPLVAIAAPSCDACIHADVCIVRAKVAGLGADLMDRIGLALAEVKAITPPTVRIVTSCSLFAPVPA